MRVYNPYFTELKISIGVRRGMIFLNLFFQIKQGNRQSEFLLHDAEFMSTLAFVLGDNNPGLIVSFTCFSMLDWRGSLSFKNDRNPYKNTVFNRIRTITAATAA